MQKIDSKEKDRFEFHLDEMIVKVENCHKEKNLNSCSKCEHYLNCELRTDYVKSVYNSMSKGDTGGFEF
ncbi:hypothetical protein HUE87_06590 [Candidatus Sulfurimonas marisnigri]|uniref:Uncharacterized protein n=1 Tax=Candidatus Sulfurimonas marisnigri TaxID=2740405 RepID=A0A7S7LY66_9BACT|nr:hypothetical protein [Candidatus Sulfurimonas marisnigri]QOY53590.1 hypothetical protein HUE87_06590 [Candidatus Sulfurimonas marisnigri]